MSKKILLLIILGLSNINCNPIDTTDNISMLEKMALFNPSLRAELDDLKHKTHLWQFAHHLKENNHDQDQQKARVAHWLEQQAQFGYIGIADIAKIVTGDKTQQEKIISLSDLMQQGNADGDELENEWIKKEIGCAAIGSLAVVGATVIAYVSS